MIEIDAVDTALIDADVTTVRAAIADEFSAKTHWWLPYLQATPRGDIPADQVGAIFDISVRGSFPSKFTAKVVEIGETQFRVEYIGGEFRGEGIWTFEPQNEKTRVSFRWHVTPVGWTSLLLSLNPTAARQAAPHHEVMRAGFAALNEHVSKREPVAA